MTIHVIDDKERSKQIDILIEEINQLFTKFKIVNYEAIWLLEHIKKQVLEGDIGV